MIEGWLGERAKALPKHKRLKGLWEIVAGHAPHCGGPIHVWRVGPRGVEKEA